MKSYAWAAVVVGLLAQNADGDEVKTKPPAEETSEGAVKANPDGTYQGVSPGATNLPPRPPKLPIAGPNRMTWPGFQVKDGVASVFLQTTGKPEYSVTDTGKGLVVTLHNTVIPLKNNKRPLKVSYFDSAVTEVDCRTKGKDVEVTIRTREGKPAHAERVEAAAGGFQLLIIELPSQKKAE